MRPTETSAAILSTPSKTPVIRPGQTATNGIGWAVEVFTPAGWQVAELNGQRLILPTQPEAEGWADACHFVRPDLDFRAYEALEGWA